MMARKSKIEAPKFLHHITARGIERCRISKDIQAQNCKTKERPLSLHFLYILRWFTLF